MVQDPNVERPDAVRRRVRRWAWLPIPCFLAAIFVLWALDLRGSHESDSLLMVLNCVFWLVVSLFVAYLIARSFLVRGTRGLLLVGCGVILLGPPGVVGTAVAQGDVNVSITIHNTCLWLAALCHLAGVFLSLRPRRTLSATALWLPGAYLLAAGSVVLVAVSSRVGSLPTFFIQGQGGTSLRQFMLGSAVAMFALTAVLLRVTSRRPRSAFAYWYTMALALIAVGLFGVMLQSYRGSVLGWTGRATQMLGGLYMLIAAVASVRESHVWGISLDAALRESEDRYRILLETAPDAIVVHRDGRFLYANHAALALTGAGTFEGLVSQTVLDFFQPQDHGLAVERAHMAVAGDRLPVREATLLRLDGQEIAVEFRTAAVDFQGARAILTIIRDITERKRAEEALRQSEENARRRAEELATLMDVTPAAVWVSDDPLCREIVGNRAAQGFYEAAKGENLSAGAIGGEQDFTRRFFQDGRELRPEELPMQMAAAKEIEVRDSEIDVLLPSGRTITILGNASPLLDAEGHVRGSIGAFVDITERKRAEEELRLAHGRLQTLFDHRIGGIGIVIANAKGDILQANDYYLSILGCTREKLASGQVDWRRMTPPEWLPADEWALAQLRERGVCDTYEKEYVCRDGSRVPVLIADAMMPGDSDDILAFVLDVTKRKRAEEALRELNATLESKVAERTAELEKRTKQLQRLTAELSRAEDRERKRIAAILHEDLQQQMAAIKFHLALLARRIKTDESLDSMTSELDEMLMKAIERSRSLSHELSPGLLHMNDMAEVLGWLAGHTQAQHGLTVHVHVCGDATLQSEATAMFLFRAAQEMLCNVVKHTGVSEAGIRVHRHGRWVCMGVSDRGPGFDPEELGESAGFGLLGIRERVESLGGRMTIRSRTGKGSTFRIVMPDGQAAATA